METNHLAGIDVRTEGSVRQNFKVLVVDDNPQNIQLLGNILKTAGFAVGYAIDGTSAINILHHSSDYDLVLLDIDMPVMNGFDTCKMIRMDSRLKNLPVIFITAFTDNDKIITGFKSGAQDYVTKPFNSDELLARVTTHLQLKYKTEQLEILNKTLELKVEERTEELRQAATKLARLDKAKSDFLILISHEMRTPLNGIVGLAELLKNSLNDSKESEYLEYLVLSAEKLLKFSDSALLITHLQLQKYNLSKDQHNLKNIIKSSIALLDERITNKEIAIILKFPDEEFMVALSKDLIELSIKSILENAISFTPSKGEIHIGITLIENSIKIHINDSGPGFSNDALLQSFEVFSAGDMAHHSEGFGLSLATVKLIMDMHNGRIEINNMKSGAEVSLILPFHV